MMHLSEANAVVAGRLLGSDAAFSAVGIDSRTLCPGDLYVAIKGACYDGHDFVAAARDAGAAGALVERPVDISLPQLVVADTRWALAQLASEWRRRCGIPVIGVTGSNGKTTVKEMIAAICAVERPVLYTRGNLNNDIGVPLTLLRLRPEHRIAVVEMGANHAGEIAYTARCAQPDIAVITNAGAAHIEGFGSVARVAKAKGEMIEALAPEGVAVLNADDTFLDFWRTLAGERRCLTFGFSEKADVGATDLKFQVSHEGFVTTFQLTYQEQKYAMSLSLAGRHNIANALAAAAACLAAGSDPAQLRHGLAAMKPVAGRLQPVRGAKGELIINDSYNANPSSLEAAMEVLVQLDGEPWLALGAFGELGGESEAFHGAMGRKAREMGIARLFATGLHGDKAVETFGAGARFFDAQTDLTATLGAELHRDVVLLVKGSRSQQMERVVEALRRSEEQ